MPEFSSSISAHDNQQRAPPTASLGEEFQSIFERETGQSISKEEAQEYAEALISLARYFTSTPSNLYDQ